MDRIIWEVIVFVIELLNKLFFKGDNNRKDFGFSNRIKISI